MDKPLPAPCPQCLIGQTQVQKPTSAVATNQKPYHSYSGVRIISIDSNITGATIKKVINV